MIETEGEDEGKMSAESVQERRAQDSIERED